MHVRDADIGAEISEIKTVLPKNDRKHIKSPQSKARKSVSEQGESITDLTTDDDVIIIDDSKLSCLLNMLIGAKYKAAKVRSLGDYLVLCSRRKKKKEEYSWINVLLLSVATIDRQQ